MSSSKVIKSENELRNLKSKINGSLIATNGCFDVLHVGHVRYLHKAKVAADVLIVGLNSDSSVRELKGKNRPINKESDRAELLSALACVDYVYIFDEDKADKFLELTKPDLYAKGADYNLENLPEKETLEKIGCMPIFIQFEEGYSSTNTINKL
jgi:rfaE bifunctional protein nucleotidyltransferase chain/domain